jgi:hypothetical protein
MKNLIRLTLSALLVLTLLVGFTGVSAITETTGYYTVYNATGDAVTELYLYEAGAEKGENIAATLYADSLYDGHALYLTYEGQTGKEVLVLEFVTKSGYMGKFETLYIEVAPLTLLAADAMTGATQIAFADTPAEYTVHNVTGEKVTELYLYPTGAEEKGENLAGKGMADSQSLVVTVEKLPEKLISADSVETGAFTIEFTTESGYTGKFETLYYEVAPLYLISADAKTGATEISFFEPSKE